MQTPAVRSGGSAPLRRLERRHLPPEGSALSTELQGLSNLIVIQPLVMLKVRNFRLIVNRHP
jgi:hypothetical protein